MTMWGFSSRKEQDNSTASTEIIEGDPKQLSPSKRSRRRIGRRRGGENEKGGGGGRKQSGPLTFSKLNGAKQQVQSTTSQVMDQKENHSHCDDHKQDINVDATDDQGIEILLDNNNNAHNKIEPKTPLSPSKGQGHHSRRSMSNHKQGRRSAPPDPKRPEQHPDWTERENVKPVIFLEKDILAKRTKIYRAQFSVLFPVQTNATVRVLEPQGKPRHRIPLGGRRWKNDLSYNDVVQLLQNANPVDEISSVRMELKKTKVEMDALEEDKEILEQRCLTLKQQTQKSDEKDNLSQLPSTLNVTNGIDWDIHRLLDVKRKMSSQERVELEKKRGRSITVYLQNPRSEDAFMNKCCGAKQAHLKKAAKRKFIATVTMDPENCRAGGAAATIRHLALLSKGSSFFVSRDNGKSYSWGQLPPRLLQRMKSQGLDPVKHCGELMYLSTGPNGYYFAEFRSGECWWGCAGEDKEFYEILQQWDVYRVVFGSTATHVSVDEQIPGREFVTNSWIVLGRDGRAAWKNLPTRLHQTLEGRLANSAAPAEVALGSGDSYFVRFLDGTIDYCLPAELASVCDRIQNSGQRIMDMALNPEVSHEFMVRHTEGPFR